MTKTSYDIGQKGEQIAQGILRQKGFEIRAVNWRPHRTRFKGGEVDVVAYHPQEKLLAFVEVKTRKSEVFGLPSEAVDKRKQAQLVALAEIFLSEYPQAADTSFRFDVMSIYFPSHGRAAEIEHIENAFQ